MPASSRSIQLTDTYRQNAASAAGIAAARVVRLFSVVSFDDLDGTYQAFVAAAAAQTAQLQAYEANLASTYLAAFVTSELRDRVDPIPPSGLVAGVDEFGRPLTDALKTPLLSVKTALLQQRDKAMALQIGTVRAARIAQTAAAWAGRQTLSEQMTASDKVIGWRRATAGSPCGACIAAATGAIRATDDVPEVHNACRCVAEPVVRGVRDRHPRPTGEQIFNGMTVSQQDALFQGRGGADKAQLIRDGMPLSRLLTRQPNALGGAVITETPLEQLQT